MRRLEWSAMLETGVPEMDNAHRALLRAIYATIDADDASLCAHISALLYRLAEDFAHEDAIMERLHAYPSASEHRASHRRALAALRHALPVAESGDADGARGLLERLPMWFIGHLNAMDLPLAVALERAVNPHSQPPVAGMRQELARMLQEQSIC